jgi:hypothetical protein
MVPVLVMANDSLLADAIVSNLAQETSLDVLRLTYQEQSKVQESIYKDCLVVIIVEEGKSNDASFTASELLRDYDCFRIITISSQKQHLRLCDTYQIPVSGVAQVIELAKGFKRENWNEAAR